jgi:2-hydroxy-3-oxopropionate reductase
MTSVAFIGLGIMGRPMAVNLVRAGFTVTGFNRSPAAVEQLRAAGGRGADSVAAAVRGAGVVATMLPDSPDVRVVLAGGDGVLASADPGTLLIDFSTIRPDVARDLAAQAARAGLRMLDAPVSGGEQGAIDGSLSIMVGGDAADLTAADPVLRAVGATIAHVGPAGAGQTVKAANQLLVGGTIGLVAEAIAFLEAHGIDPGTAIPVLAGGLAGSAVLDRKAAAMAARQFRPGFRATLHHKDLGIVTAAAREAGVAVPLTALTAQLMGALNARGDGGLDHGALLRIIEDLSGRSRPGITRTETSS